jgi:LCP family protein required for cell wall assembly
MTDTAPPRAPRHLPEDRRPGRPRFRRARGLPGTLGVTAMATLLPGSGFLYARRRALGLLVLVPALLLGGLGGWYLYRNPDAAVDLVFDTQQLGVVAVALVVVLTAWVATIVLTYLMVRTRPRPRWHGFVGYAFVALMCAAVTAPLAVAARYSVVQADLVEHVFQDNRSATVPQGVTEKDPWGGRDRVNVLLLGGDGNIHRDGVRTDSIILASIDVRSGRTVLFSLPRNLMHAQFAKGSPLRKLYPDGYQGDGDPNNYLLNAVYGIVPALHPGVLGKSDNEGADAIKLAVQGILRLPVDYYVLVNLNGFRAIVDAMGGVTVNVNQPVPIGGNTDLGIPPDDYIEPGPDKELNGFEALWFSRGRYGSDDYQRMERQRCMIGAIVDEAKPVNLLRRYQALAAAGRQLVRTDIPSDLLPAFVDLATEMKGRGVRSVVFRRSEAFEPSNPDFEWMREKVRKALAPPAPRDPGLRAGGGSPAQPPRDAEDQPAAAVDTADSCGYQPAS